MHISDASVFEHAIGEIFGGGLLLTFGYLISFLFGRDERQNGIIDKPGIRDCIKSAFIALLSLLFICSLAYFAYYFNSHSGFRNGFFCCICITAIPTWSITGARKLLHLRYFIRRREQFAEWEESDRQATLLEQELAQFKAQVDADDAFYKAQEVQVHMLAAHGRSLADQKHGRSLADQKEENGVTKDLIDPLVASINDTEASAEQKMKTYLLEKQDQDVKIARIMAELEKAKIQRQITYDKLHSLKDIIK